MIIWCINKLNIYLFSYMGAVFFKLCTVEQCPVPTGYCFCLFLWPDKKLNTIVIWCRLVPNCSWEGFDENTLHQGKAKWIPSIPCSLHHDVISPQPFFAFPCLWKTNKQCLGTSLIHIFKPANLTSLTIPLKCFM